jgi:integrase
MLRLVKKKVKQPDGSYANSRTWYLRGTVREFTVDESTRTDDKAAADQIRIKREAELLHRSIHGAEATMSFAEAANLYLDAGGDGRFLNPIIAHFGVTMVNKIGQPEIDAAASVLYPGRANETLNRQVYTPVVSVLRHVGRVIAIKRPKQKPPAIPRPDKHYATPETYARLVEDISDLPHLRRLVLFMTFTGRRVSECVRLDWERDMDLQHRIAYMGVTKNGEPVTVYIPSPVFEELANVEVKKGRVFGYTDSKAPNRAIKRRCERIGIPYLSCHKLGRHTFATWMRRYGGLDLKGVMGAAGWKDPKSADRYMHVMPDELPAARAKLPGIGNNPGSEPSKYSKLLRKKV